MVITVGGMLIISGIVVTIITVAGTIFVAFATGMSDAPETKMSWTPSIIGMALGIAMILIGGFSGL